MLILHTALQDSTLFLWAEQSLASLEKLPQDANKNADSSASRQLPFDAGFDGLTRALNSVQVWFKLYEELCKPIKLWMPTHKGEAIASSALISSNQVSDTELALEPWVVKAHPLSYESVVDLLSVCMDKRMLAPGILIGNDLYWWSQALRFAGSLVVRQQYLPGIVQDFDNEYSSKWVPVYLLQDVETLNKLAKDMPLVARSATAMEVMKPLKDNPLDLLKLFLQEAVDYLVRFAAPGSGSSQTNKRIKPRKYNSVHDAWLHILQTSDGKLDYPADELSSLCSDIQEWRSPLDSLSTSTYRFCFKVEAPESVNDLEHSPTPSSVDRWTIEYCLQPIEDLTQIIPLEAIWNNDAKNSNHSSEGDLKEFIYSSLGQASEICPFISDSLETDRPTGYLLDTPSAYLFLTKTVSALKQSGFNVILPAWWTRKGATVKPALRACIDAGSKPEGKAFTLQSITDFQWEMALGGKQLTLEELESLAALKTPLIRFRGQWVEINPEETQKALDFWKQSEVGKASALEIIQMAIGAKSTVNDIAVEGIQANGWIGELLEQLTNNEPIEELDPPASFIGTLRAYQIRGYSWLHFLRKWGLGACLADDMGLGKTIQALALLQFDWSQNRKRPTLLVCPTSVVNNWKKEAERFTPDLPVVIHHGVGRMKGVAFRNEVEKHAVVISSFGLLQRDIELFKSVSWAGVILDEAQNIKNPDTKQARAARSISADYRIALTGTPIENNVGDLWSIMEFLNPGFLGNQSDFKKSYFIPIQVGHDMDTTMRLKKITSPFILRRLKTDKTIINDLPEKQEMKVYCHLTEEQASLYTAVLNETEALLNQSDGIQRKGIILATLSKLKQICNHPAHFLSDQSSLPDRSGKLSRLTEMIEEILSVGERILIFSQFKIMGGLLQTYLQEMFNREVLFLHGSTTRKQRDSIVDRFQQDEDGPRILVLSLKAGGTGLNLYRANHVFHYDRWWNPAVEDQATDRAFRIGQIRNVQVHKFICAGTLEEKIDEMIERKQLLAKQVVGVGENWLTELSNDELKELFSLREEAIGE